MYLESLERLLEDAIQVSPRSWTALSFRAGPSELPLVVCWWESPKSWGLFPKGGKFLMEGNLQRLRLYMIYTLFGCM